MPALLNRRANSYFTHNNDGAIREFDCFTCAHGAACGQQIIVMSPGVAQGTHWDFCMKCMKPICLSCAKRMAAMGGECQVLEQTLLKMERLRPVFENGQRAIDRDMAILLGSR